MKKLMILVAALALLSAIAVPPAYAEFGSNADRGYGPGQSGHSGGGGGGGWEPMRGGGRSWMDHVRDFFGGSHRNFGSIDRNRPRFLSRDEQRGHGNNRGNGTRSSPTRGGAYD